MRRKKIPGMGTASEKAWSQETRVTGEKQPEGQCHWIIECWGGRGKMEEDWKGRRGPGLESQTEDFIFDPEGNRELVEFIE